MNARHDKATRELDALTANVDLGKLGTDLLDAGGRRDDAKLIQLGTDILELEARITRLRAQEAETDE